LISGGLKLKSILREDVNKLLKDARLNFYELNFTGEIHVEIDIG